MQSRGVTTFLVQLSRAQDGRMLLEPFTPSNYCRPAHTALSLADSGAPHMRRGDHDLRNPARSLSLSLSLSLSPASARPQARIQHRRWPTSKPRRFRKCRRSVRYSVVRAFKALARDRLAGSGRFGGRRRDRQTGENALKIYSSRSRSSPRRLALVELGETCTRSA